MKPITNRRSKNLSVIIALVGLIGSTVLPLLAAPAKAADSSATAARNSLPELRLTDFHRPQELSFEPNQEQANGEIKFIAHGEGFGLLLTADGAVIRPGSGQESDWGLTRPAAPGSLKQSAHSQSQIPHPAGTALRMRLAGSNRAARMEGIEPQTGTSNYIIGNQPANWRTKIANYAKVRQAGVYPGIDLVYYGNPQRLEYDLIVAARADYQAITLAFDGAERIQIDANGDLLIATPGGEVRQRKPFIYQEANGIRKEIAGRYKIKGRGRVGFSLGTYDRSKRLVIDPEIVYATYFGGSRFNTIRAITADAAGNTYVTGDTTSADFPVTAGGYQNHCTCENPVSPLFPDIYNSDAFVAKFDSTGKLIYSTFLGGLNGEDGRAIALDASGNVYITGQTNSNDFPVTAHALKTPLNGMSSPDVFVASFDATGALAYSTLLGGSLIDLPTGIAIDAAGNACVAGSTISPDFPIVNGFRSTLTQVLKPGGTHDIYDGFMAKLNADGSARLYSTYIGTGDSDYAGPIAVDQAGKVYVSGVTYSETFPTRNAFQPAKAKQRDGFIDGGRDAFLVQIDTSLAGDASLLYSTYFGGNGLDGASAIAIDRAGLVCIAGSTTSTDLPMKHPLQQANANITDNLYDGFLAKFDLTRSGVDQLAYSTYFGGSKDELVTGMALDAAGNVYLTGKTESLDLPLVNALFTGGPLARSTDGGNHFSSDSRDMGITEVNILAVDPQAPSTLYAGDYGFGLFKTSDGGTTWKDIATIPAIEQTKVLAVDPKTPATIYAGVIADSALAPRIYKSNDGGGSWHATGLMLQGQAVNTIVIDPQNPSVIYVGTSAVNGVGAGVFKSLDGGNTWALLSNGMGNVSVSALAMSPENPAVLYAGTAAGLFVSNNSGKRWETGGITGYIKSLKPDPKNSATIYAGVVDAAFGLAFLDPDGRGNPRRRVNGGTQENAAGVSSLLKSTDAGKSWHLINTGLPNFLLIYDLAIDPQNPSIVYAGSDNGLYRSTNGGGTWQRQESINGEVQAIALNPQATSTVYAGAEFYGGNFLAALSADGSRLLYSSYFGGNGVAVDSAGNIYLGGDAYSPNFPVTNAFQPTRRGNSPAFLARLTGIGAAPVRIASVSATGRKLIVTGENFSVGAVIMLNGSEQFTANDAQAPTTSLVGKKAAKKVHPGNTVTIQVKNPDGAMSNSFIFTRQ